MPSSSPRTIHVAPAASPRLVSHGLSTWHPRRRRDSSPTDYPRDPTEYAAAESISARAALRDARGPRGGAAALEYQLEERVDGAGLGGPAAVARGDEAREERERRRAGRVHRESLRVGRGPRGQRGRAGPERRAPRLAAAARARVDELRVVQALRVVDLRASTSIGDTKAVFD